MTTEQLAAVITGMIFGFLLFLVLVVVAVILWQIFVTIVKATIFLFEERLRKRKAKRTAKQHTAGGRIWASKADYILSLKRPKK
jgi:hypothetical protein